MTKLTDELLSPHLQALKPYESARRLFSGGQVWLNANESPFSNEYTLRQENFNRYPSCQPDPVIDAYARYAGLDKQNVLVSRGADEGIELLIRTFCTPGQDKILICPPTYGMYAISAETHNVGIEKAPLNPDFSLDLELIKSFKGQVNLVFICSPNNPTGTSVARDQVEEVVDVFRDSALVVVDEAYIEFDPDNSWHKQIERYSNLVILRTLSKAFALAGLRCGFTLAHQDVIQALLKVIAPYPIAEPVAQIAAQALSVEGIARMQEQVASLQMEKQRVKDTLESMVQVELIGDDKANFVLFRTGRRQALMNYLVEQGLLIRDQSKQPRLGDCLRVTVGNREQNDLLLAEISSFFAQQESAV